MGGIAAMLDHRVSAPCPTRLGWNPQTQDLLCAVPQKFWNQTIWFRILSDLFIIYIYIILHTVSSKIKLNKDTVSTHIYMYIHIYTHYLSCPADDPGAPSWPSGNMSSQLLKDIRTHWLAPNLMQWL